MERLGVADYFREALGVLGQQGSRALTIAALCDRLAVTKGSFYHHFGGMPAFVDQLLAYWEEQHSGRLIAISRSQPDPALRITTLVDMAVDLPHASESAIRAWGRSCRAVAEVVERVDERRERDVVEAVEALGIDCVRARLLGRICVDLLIGIQTHEVPPDPSRIRQLLKEVQRLIFLEADPKLVDRVLANAGG